MRHLVILLALAGCVTSSTPPDDTDTADTDAGETDTDTEETNDSDTEETDDTDDSDDTDGVALTCGEETCDGTTAYCLSEYPGMPPDTSDTAGPPDYTTCVGLSAECLEDVSCACLERTGVVDEVASCSGTAATGLSVVIAYP